MAMFFEVTDAEYLVRIYNGLQMPTKLAVTVGDNPEKVILKKEKDYTAKDQALIMKDAKVRQTSLA